jgi:ApbE superfamily uncharacterized protein (UPF0280 family)
MVKKPKPEKRFYRELAGRKGFSSFEIIAGESDLWVSVPARFHRDDLKEVLTEHLIHLRTQLLSYGERHPEFFTSLAPVCVPVMAPAIVKKMAEGAKAVGVGPMAGVAGAINFYIGKRLKERKVPEFFIENGGDVYLVSEEPTTLAIFTGVKEFDGKLGLSLPPGEWSVCSSSSTIGHSLSLGATNIAVVVGKDPVITDCSATFMANSKTQDEFVNKTKHLKEVEGVLGLIDGRFVLKGNIKLVRIGIK